SGSDPAPRGAATVPYDTVRSRRKLSVLEHGPHAMSRDIEDVGAHHRARCETELEGHGQRGGIRPWGHEIGRAAELGAGVHPGQATLPSHEVIYRTCNDRVITSASGLKQLYVLHLNVCRYEAAGAEAGPCGLRVKKDHLECVVFGTRIDGTSSI